MNVIRCKNGHFFDGDSYDKCPHCGESAITSASSPSVPKEEKKGFWGRGKKEKETVPPRTEISPPPVVPSSNDFGNGDTPTESGNNSTPATPTPHLGKNPTLDFWQTPSHSESEAVEIPAEKKADAPVIANTDSESDSAVDGSDAHKKSELEVEKHRIEEEEVVAPSSPLKAAVKNASASNEGKTMSYFSSATAPSSSNNQPKQPSEPVVGWLVCVKGYHFGECFSIYAGKNSIGRSSENRIVIEDDNSISRVKHALIVYEPKKRNFYLQPGDSSGLTYLNDDYITDSHKLNSHDMIELGDSKFMFVPLCGETFSWEDHIPKGE